jgi:uncharacterized membrane protein YgcG
MKKIFGFILVLAMGLSLTSCAVTAEAQTEDIYVSSNGVDVNVIVTYGTPYYNADGFLLYYIYRNYYYYPYFLNDRWYFRSYSRPLRYARPVPRDFYRHRPPVNHRRHHDARPPRGNHHHNGNVRPNVQPPRGGGRPNGGVRQPSVNTRPNGQVRSSTRVQSQPRPQMSNRSGGNFSRPASPQRSSTRSGGGHFGGRR